MSAQPAFDLVAHIDASPGSELGLRDVHADLLVVDMASLHMETVDWLVRAQHLIGARQMLVMYGFAATQVLDALRARGAVLRRSPLGTDELLHALHETVRGWQSVSLALRQMPDPAPSPRLDPARMQELVASMPRVACECPTHLAELVTMLAQFERYSADCESRQPADVALHAYLYRVAGHARAIMEEALLTLARAEGLMPMDAQAPASV